MKLLTKDFKQFTFNSLLYGFIKQLGARHSFEGKFDTYILVGEIVLLVSMFLVHMSNSSPVIRLADCHAKGLCARSYGVHK